VIILGQFGPRLVKDVVPHQELERERQDQPEYSDEEGITGVGGAIQVTVSQLTRNTSAERMIVLNALPGVGPRAGMSQTSRTAPLMLARIRIPNHVMSARWIMAANLLAGLQC